MDKKENRWKQLISAMFVVLLVGILAVNSVYGTEDANKQGAPKTEESIEVNSEAPDFTLKDVDGKDVTLSKIEDKIVVLEWTNYDCPFVKAHYASDNQTTNKVAEEYKDKDVVWLVINSTNYTTAEKNKEWAKEVGLKQTILLDTDGKVGKLYYAKTTPHLFVIDKDGKVAYQGAYDNAPLGRTPDGENYVNYVDQTLAELLADKEVSVPKTKPYGCSVKYPKEDVKE